MRKGLRMIRCSGCGKYIWRKDIEGWCFGCRKFYELLSAIPQESIESFFFHEGEGV